MTKIIEIIKIKGMHCVSCENRIKEAISTMNGVKDAKVDYTKEKATVEFDQTKTNINNIMNVIRDIGYQPEMKELKGLFKKLLG